MPRTFARSGGTSRSGGGTKAAPGAGTGACCDRRGRGADRPRAAQGVALPASPASGSFSTPYSCGLTAGWTTKPPICYREPVRAGASIILPWVCAGCVTTVAAQRPLSSEKTEEINELIAGKTADLGLEGAPQVITGKNLRIEGSSLLFLKQDAVSTEESPPWLPAETPVASVRRIEVTRRGRGALIGLGIGVPIGFVAGTVTTSTLLSTVLCESGSCSQSHTGPALLGGVLGGLAFGLLGAGIGALIGSPASIEFSDTPSR